MLLLTALGISFSAWANKLPDEAAIAGLHQAKAVYLVNVGSPGSADHIVHLIGLTRHQLLSQKVKPEFIVVFIGQDVSYLAKDRRGISYKDERAVADMQKEIGSLAHDGVQFQACGVALHGMDVTPQMLISDVTPVDNGFISIIAYQEKGYALVPVP